MGDTVARNGGQRKDIYENPGRRQTCERDHAGSVDVDDTEDEELDGYWQGREYTRRNSTMEEDGQQGWMENCNSSMEIENGINEEEDGIGSMEFVAQDADEIRTGNLF